MHFVEAQLELKQSEAGSFVGLAAVYGNKDSHGDIIEPGAFSKTLAERGSEVPLLFGHDTNNPVGIGTVYETHDGLGIKGQLDLDTQSGREAYSRLRKGIIRGLSIGYASLKDAWDSTRQVRRLLELKLFEVSLVVFPSNERARVSTVKGESAIEAAIAEWRSMGDRYAMRRQAKELEVLEGRFLAADARLDGLLSRIRIFQHGGIR